MSEKENERKTFLIAAGIAFLLIFVILGFLIVTKDRRVADTNQAEESQLEEAVDIVDTEDLDQVGEGDAAVEEEDSADEDTALDEQEQEEIEETLFPDLYVLDYTLSEEEPTQNEEITVEIQIKNDGDEDADEFSWQWWSDEYTLSCEDQVGFLDVDETETVTCEFIYDDYGTLKTKVVLDPDDEVDESDETNNIQEEEIIVLEQMYVDLTISEYSFDPVPKKGVDFEVRIGIKNEGNLAAEDFYWEWWGTAYNYASGCRNMINTLAPNSEKVVTCEYRYDGCAKYDTKAVIDADDDVEESDEDNNEYAEELVVPCT